MRAVRSMGAASVCVCVREDGVSKRRKVTDGQIVSIPHTISNTTILMQSFGLMRLLFNTYAFHARIFLYVNFFFFIGKMLIHSEDIVSRPVVGAVVYAHLHGA